VSDLDTSRFWLDALKWDADGLIPVISEDAVSGRTLMVAWMNREALQETVASGKAVYWSRSRQRLWRKGEESGHEQKVRTIRADCDGDVLLLSVDQVGGIACHTGRESCFFLELREGRWVPADPALKEPGEIYAKK
jgi:phosphoribosyl-AMP cyclohydrolase